MFSALRSAPALPTLLLWLAATSPVRADGFQEASGVNLTADEGFGARHSGMATTFSGFQRDANAVANSPAGINDVDDFAFATAHAEKFGEAKYDDFAVLIPFEARSTLGVGLARYGVSDIEYRDGTHPFQSQPDGLFSAADYLVVAGFARRWGGLDAGINLHMLYRQLDQDGFGVRSDAMVQYTWDGLVPTTMQRGVGTAGRMRVAALIKGLLPSSARWESGYAEYESPDVQLGASFRIPLPYFYGTWEVAGQTEGLLRKAAKSQSETNGATLFEDPTKNLAMSNFGTEFLFDFGLALRFGLSQLDLSGDAASATTFGIGYNWRGIAGIDYSFTPHADLLASHRISLQVTPSFRNFHGRGFRAQGKPSVAVRRMETSAPPPPAAEPTRAAPEKTAPPSSGASPAPAPEPEKKPAQPEPDGKEILEQDE